MRACVAFVQKEYDRRMPRPTCAGSRVRAAGRCGCARGYFQAGGCAEPMESDEHRTNTVRRPLEKRENRENLLLEEKEEHFLFFENMVFTVFAFLQQFPFGFRAVFVGVRQCGCDLFLFRYPKICPPRCVRAFAFFFLANRRRLCRGNGQPSLSCVVTWVVPVA